jgi:integrase
MSGMNRPFVNRGKPVPGVFQRCEKTCPPDVCNRHRWGFVIELPARADGKRRQVTKSGFESGRKAQIAREEVARADRDKQLGDDLNATLGPYVSAWIDGKEQRNEIKRSTARGYRDSAKNHIVPKIGRVKLREVTGTVLTRFYAEIAVERDKAIAAAKKENERLAAEAERVNAARKADSKTRTVRPKRVPVPRKLTPPTIHRIHALISGALGDAVPDLIPRNPAQDAKLPRVTKKKVKPPTPEQVGVFLDAMESERLYPLVVLSGYSGLRRGELCGAEWSDVDLKTGRFVMRRQRTSVGYVVEETEAKSESGQDRVLYFDEGTIAVLKSWKAAQNKERLAWGAAYVNSGKIFTRENGEPLHPDYVTKVVSRMCRRAGLPATLHTFRHFRAAVLISSGADIAVVSKVLGHASVNVTADIYGSLFETASKELADRAAKLIPRQSSTA